MRKFYNWLVNVEKDKLLHFMVSFFITLFSFAILNRYFRDIHLSIIYSGLVALSIGAAKEAYDEYIYKEGDVKDFKADIVGFIIAAIFCLLL